MMTTNKRILTLCKFTVLALCSFNLSSVVAQTASVSATAKSFQLLPANPVFVSGLGNVYTYFSTYNGANGDFLIDLRTGGVSGEIRPRWNTPGVYEAGYAQTTAIAAVDYGSITVNISESDSDGNGVPDFLQLNRATSLTVTGSGFSVPVNAPFTISVTLSRSANQATGTYNASTQFTGKPSTFISGKFVVEGYKGTLSYSTVGPVNTLQFSLSSLSSGFSFTGSTTYAVSENRNMLYYPEFVLTRSSDNARFSVKAGSLNRTGNQYNGTMSLVDGIIETSWPDFLDYWVNFTDTNDTDGDGIPNLTDNPLVQPAITAQPSSQSVTVGATITLTVSATGSSPLSYQWRRDGNALDGATSSTLSLINVQTASTGNYTVVVTNPVGSVTSNAATVTVNAVVVTPPSSANSGGGGGGGGTISWPFLAAIGFLLSLRVSLRHFRQ